MALLHVKHLLIEVLAAKERKTMAFTHKMKIWHYCPSVGGQGM